MLIHDVLKLSHYALKQCVSEIWDVVILIHVDLILIHYHQDRCHVYLNFKILCLIITTSCSLDLQVVHCFSFFLLILHYFPRTLLTRGAWTPAGTTPGQPSRADISIKNNKIPNWASSPKSKNQVNSMVRGQNFESWIHSDGSHTPNCVASTSCQQISPPPPPPPHTFFWGGGAPPPLFFGGGAPYPRFRDLPTHNILGSCLRALSQSFQALVFGGCVCRLIQIRPWLLESLARAAPSKGCSFNRYSGFLNIITTSRSYFLQFFLSIVEALTFSTIYPGRCAG